MTEVAQRFGLGMDAAGCVRPCEAPAPSSPTELERLQQWVHHHLLTGADGW